jgi:hypothetical protein
MSIDGIKVHDAKTQPWHNPWLIQRLEKPHEKRGNGLDLGEIFSFGGGLVRGGMSKEAHALISKLWRWDYMGASEFEWGAVPAALNALVQYRQADHLAAFEIVLEGPQAIYRTAREQEMGWADKTDDKRSAKAKVFVACNKSHRDTVVAVLTKMVGHRSWGDGIELKEMARAWDACFGDRDVIGGLELDNAWVYLSAHKAAASVKGFCELFEVTAETVPDIPAPKPVLDYVAPKKAKRRG